MTGDSRRSPLYFFVLLLTAPILYFYYSANSISLGLSTVFLDIIWTANWRGEKKIRMAGDSCLLLHPADHCSNSSARIISYILWTVFFIFCISVFLAEFELCFLQCINREPPDWSCIIEIMYLIHQFRNISCKETFKINSIPLVTLFARCIFCDINIFMADRAREGVASLIYGFADNNFLANKGALFQLRPHCWHTFYSADFPGDKTIVGVNIC